MSGNILFVDSFDHLNSAYSSSKWLGTHPTYIAGRTGNGVLGAGILAGFDLSGTVCEGFAYYVSILQGSACWLGNAISGLTLIPYIAADGRMYVSTPWGSTSPTIGPVISAGVWYYITLIANHYGQYIDVTLKLNGQTVISETIDMHRTLSEEGFSYIRTASPGGGGYSIIDDLYVTDGEDLGDVRIFVIRPNAEGYILDWLPKNGGLHYLETKDIVPDGVASYIYTNTNNLQDMTHLEDINYVGDIMGIQANFIAAKDEAGQASFRQCYRLNGADIVGKDCFPSLTAWKDFRDPYRINPVTGLDFTNSDINAMQMGAKRLT